MVNRICKHCHLKGCRSGCTPVGDCPPKLKKYLAVLETESHSYKCNVDYLIRNVNISKEKLNYLCELYFSLTPRQILENLRIERALNLLIIKENIYEAAINCGYIEIGTFRKAIERRLGNSPTILRNKILETIDGKIIKKNMIDKLWKHNS
jgi:AraC-like DNA-binding protein